MSGNSKQTASGGQQMRFSTYQPMQQTLPPRETFLANQNYVPQPNQASTQGVALRGIAQTGPPNQAPTPPNQDIKVQGVPGQQAPMNIYTQQNTVRSTQQPFYRPPGPPPTQNARMTNNPQRIYQNTPHQYMPIPPMSNVYLNPMGYFNTGQQRQSYVQPQVTLLQSQHYPTAYQAFTPPQLSQTPQTVGYPFYPFARPGPPQPASTPSNPNQPSIATTIPLQQPVIPQQSTPRQRRPKAISIIDPNTGEDRLAKMYEVDNSQPASGGSSARQTPQPAPHNPSKEVQAPYVKPMSYISSIVNLMGVEYDGVAPSSQATDEVEDFPDLFSMLHASQQPPVSRNNAKYDHLAQTSTLKAHAKEFVLPSAKEPPVVSANCDSVEVTLNKLQKGRESPVKGRKAKDHHKESNKDTTHPPKETHQPEKQQIPVVKEEVEAPAPKPKETTPPNNNNLPVSSKVTEKENDKRKKESKSDNKQATETSTNDNAKQANQDHETAPPVAKSKQNSNQKKDNHKTNNNQRANVPAPQPAKSNSKTIKKNELNSKGASKEGNDMDVFQIADTVNANVPPPQTTVTNNNDVLNANAPPVTNNVTPVVAEPIIAPNDTISKTESNNVAPVKPVPEVKTTPKRWDVTDVFMGRLPEPSPYVPSPVTEATQATQDETDRAVVTNDRPAQVTTEGPAAAATQAPPTPVVVKKPDLPYKEGQWSPFNTEGNKKYDKEFLLAIRNLPTSRIKPANLPESLECFEGSRQRSSDSRDNRYSNSMMGKDFTTPPFLNPYGGKNSSMKGSSITKHPSLSGKMGNKGGKSINGGNKISISLREDIKLHESENAWKPGRLNKGADNKTEEDRKTEDLFKKVRGILNKLTPQKFDTLLSQIKALKVDTMERLQGFINLVFEKAIDEPNFAVAYAKMCMEVAMMQVIQVTDDGREEAVHFRKLLITRCQEEFEKQSRDETKTEGIMKEIESCQDAEKKKALEEELDEAQRQIRIRSVGNVRFIGELFKINMLTVNIMTVCMSSLMLHKDEDSLECLCRLLTTIGRKLEEHKDIQSYFDAMQKIVNEKKVSSRIRFMLQDVIDLRRNKWVPRRQDAGPKTMDQISKDMATEQLNSQLSSMPSTSRKDDRDMGKSKPRAGSEEWKNQRSTTFMLNKDKLKISKQPTSEDETFGKPSMFKIWNKGSQYKGPVPFSVTDTSNRFSLLDTFGENDKKIVAGPSSSNNGGRYKDSAYNSKGSSLERGSYGKQSYDSRGGSRSGSQHRVNEGAGPSGHGSSSTSAAPSLPMSRSAGPPPAAPKPPTTPPAPTAAPVVPALPAKTDEQLRRFCKNCCEEYINDNCKFEECETDIRATVPTSYFPTMISNAVLDVLESSKTPRMKLGVLLGKLLKCGTTPLPQFSQALEDIFSQVEDLIIDIPTIWSCLADILVPIIIEGGLSLEALHKCSKLIIANNMGHKMLPPLFKLIICEKGPNYLKDLWQSSKLKFTDFMSDSVAETFIEEHQLEFLTGGTPAQGNSELNYEQIEAKLLEFFESNTPFDDICMWITANVGKRVEESSFIRTLATAIYKFSIVRTKLNSERLSRHSKLFNKYVDNSPTYELQCLYALQTLVNNLEHPQGLLLSIFNKLSEDSIFAQESFLAWENSKDTAEQEGKGVALKQLTSFFTQLKENDDEDYGSTGSDEA